MSPQNRNVLMVCFSFFRLRPLRSGGQPDERSSISRHGVRFDGRSVNAIRSRRSWRRRDQRGKHKPHAAAAGHRIHPAFPPAPAPVQHAAPLLPPCSALVRPSRRPLPPAPSLILVIRHMDMCMVPFPHNPPIRSPPPLHLPVTPSVALCCRCNASAAVLPASTWSSSMLLLPNSYDFPLLPDVLGAGIQVTKTPIYP